MSKLTLAKPDAPVLEPGDAIPLRPLHAPRAAVIVIDVRTTGLLYHDDDTPNSLSVPYSVALVASILDDDNKMIPYDVLAFRIAVPGYLTLDTDLTTLMKRLEGVAYHMANTPEREKARAAAQVAFDNEGVPIPFISVSRDEYDPANLEHGVSQAESAALLKEFVGRFQGGAVIAGQNLRLVLEMLDRIGYKLDVESNVYHRMMEMYSVFLASALGAGGLAGIPALVDIVEVPEGEERNALARAQYISAYLEGAVGTGSLPGAVFAVDSNVSVATDSLTETTMVQIGNVGMEDVTVTPSFTGDEFSGSTDPFTIAGGDVTVFAVDFTATEDGTYTGAVSFDDGTNTVTIDVEVQLASA